MHRPRVILIAITTERIFHGSLGKKLRVIPLWTVSSLQTAVVVTWWVATPNLTLFLKTVQEGKLDHSYGNQLLKRELLNQMVHTFGWRLPQWNLPTVIKMSLQSSDLIPALKLNCLCHLITICLKFSQSTWLMQILGHPYMIDTLH